MKKKDAPRGFVFYSQDYFGDVLVRLMPPELRLAWVEAFLLMDQSPRRGVLLKKNGEPFSQSELAKVMNCSTDNVQKMFDWVVKEGIASVDRRSNTLMNRRMFREENRRKINEKNGRKGGNPALITASAKTVLAVSVNPNDNRPDKSRARVPDPEPDPEPDSPRPVHASSNHTLPRPEKRGSVRAARETSSAFQEIPADLPISLGMQAWWDNHDPPFQFNLHAEHEHFIAWARSKKIQTADTEEAWRNWMLNPLRTQGANNGNGQRQAESKGEFLVRKQREENERLHRALHGSTGDGAGSGDSRGEEHPVHPRLVGPD